MKRKITRVIIDYSQCEECEGTGLKHNDGKTYECEKCQGHGEYMIQKTRKELMKDE